MRPTSPTRGFKYSILVLILAFVLGGAPTTASAKSDKKSSSKRSLISKIVNPFGWGIKKDGEGSKEYKKAKIKKYDFPVSAADAAKHVDKYKDQLASLKNDLKKNGDNYDKKGKQKLNDDIAKLESRIEKEKGYQQQLTLIAANTAKMKAQRAQYEAKLKKLRARLAAATTTTSGTDENGNAVQLPADYTMDYASTTTDASSTDNGSALIVKAASKALAAPSKLTTKVSAPESQVRGPASIAPSTEAVDGARI
jgi:hypothetical protein